MLDQDEHNVVAVQALSGPVQDVLLDSTVPMLDMVRAVVDLYAEVEHLDVPQAGSDGGGFDVGRAAGLGLAVRQLALIYHDDPKFRQEWQPGDGLPDGSVAEP
jgi:hypothetical protein